jgi:hypothetical protein
VTKLFGAAIKYERMRNDAVPTPFTWNEWWNGSVANTTTTVRPARVADAISSTRQVFSPTRIARTMKSRSERHAGERLSPLFHASLPCTESSCRCVMLPCFWEETVARTNNDTDRPNQSISRDVDQYIIYTSQLSCVKYQMLQTTCHRSFQRGSHESDLAILVPIVYQRTT